MTTSCRPHAVSAAKMRAECKGPAGTRPGLSARETGPLSISRIRTVAILAGAGHACGSAARHGALGYRHGARYGGAARARARAVTRGAAGYGVRRAVGRCAEQIATGEQSVL